MQMLHIGGLYTNGRGDFLESHFVICSIKMLCNIIYSFITADGQAYILVANEVSAYAHIVRKLELSTVRVGGKYLFSVNLMSAWKILLVNWYKMFCVKSFNQNIKLQFFCQYLSQSDCSLVMSYFQDPIAPENRYPSIMNADFHKWGGHKIHEAFGLFWTWLLEEHGGIMLPYYDSRKKMYQNILLCFMINWVERK